MVMIMFVVVFVGNIIVFEVIVIDEFGYIDIV